MKKLSAFEMEKTEGGIAFLLAAFICGVVVGAILYFASDGGI
ncbi:MAG TPA: hypothetical protein VGD40_26240 [Chryseosolibacter sp.]